MSVVLEQPRTLLPGRFEWLMGLYAENYHRLTRLFHPQQLALGAYRSSLDDGLDLRLDVLERHRYTLDLKLTYCFVDDETGHHAPSAQLRMYEDAHLAEVLACHPDRRLARAIGLLRPSRAQFHERVRASSFLNRWLEYLASQGHSAGTLEPLPLRAGASAAA
ncbi:DUF1249 domain-containing protein [Dokdonella sp.]|uniref:DUF1249 domain-containing protein n=1 Tax=Dokdonella sp. TaxID=2291710 RepID=UPI0031C659BA|nr:DUF1249 domain-containing protein [Dokdonella sp.]